MAKAALTLEMAAALFATMTGVADIHVGCSRKMRLSPGSAYGTMSRSVCVGLAPSRLKLSAGLTMGSPSWGSPKLGALTSHLWALREASKKALGV
jgi:hypothetical protein